MSYVESINLNDAGLFSALAKSVFLSKEGPPTGPFQELRDGDTVLYVRMTERLGYIPGFCYALNLDPNLIDKCPPRTSRNGVPR